MARRSPKGGTHSAVYTEAALAFPNEVKEKAKEYREEFSESLLGQAEAAFTVALGEVKFGERQTQIVEWRQLHDTYLAQAAEVIALNQVLRTVESHIETTNTEYAESKAWCKKEREYLRSRHIHESGPPVDGVPQTHPLFLKVIDLESDLALCVTTAKAVIQEQIDIAVEVGDDALAYARLCQDEHDRKDRKDVPERSNTISGLLSLTE